MVGPPPGKGLRMKIGYDVRGDILFVDLGDLGESQGAKEIAPGVYLDITADGKVLGLEILEASKRYPKEQLEQMLAYPEESISLAEAARISGLTPVAMRKAAERGRLQAKKIGRNWTTTAGALTEYLNSRKHEGPGSALAEDAFKAFALPSVNGRQAAGVTQE